MDNFTLYYLKFLRPKKSKNKGNWLNIMNTPSFYSWTGNAFEIICLQHILQIKKAMGIVAVYTEESTWHNENTQIDLIMERKDDIINLFEFKFSAAEFTIDKKYAENLRNKVSAFIENYKTKSAIWLVMLTTYGVKNNAYNDMVKSALTMNILFND